MAHRSSALVASRLALGGSRSYRLAQQQQRFALTSIKALSSSGNNGSGVRSNKSSCIGFGKLPSAGNASGRTVGDDGDTVIVTEREREREREREEREKSERERESMPQAQAGALFLSNSNLGCFGLA